MKATIYRDTFGVPHVYADSDAEACFAVGYAQAEDRLESVLRNHRLAEGRLSEIGGPQWLDHDFEKRLLRIPDMARNGLLLLSPEVRGMVDAYVSGVHHYMQSHPQSVPDGAEVPRPEQVVALAYWLTIQWSLPDAKQELNWATAEPSQHSNAWAVSPRRSRTRDSLLLIDPHVPWIGTYRWYELHIEASALHCAGFCVCGIPFPALGFNRSLGWATTVGGPDCADIYEVRVDRDAGRCHLGGEIRPLQVDTCEVKVARSDGLITEAREHLHCDLGPIVQLEGSRSLAMALSYWGQTRLLEQLYRMNTANDIDGFVGALSLMQFPQMNFVFADRAGNIGYWLNGRCPRRNEELDWTRPVPADDPRSRWQGVHALEELPHLRNPSCGYLQNCNVTPDRVVPESPLRGEAFPSYVFYTHAGDVHRPRSERALALLSQADQCSVAEMRTMAMDKRVLPARPWIRALSEACDGRGVDGGRAEALKALKAWDGYADSASSAASIFDCWRRHFQAASPHVTPSNEHRHVPVSDEAQEVAHWSFCEAVDYLIGTFGSLDVPLGSLQRLQRSEKSYPLGGGGVRHLGLECLRAIECEEPDERGRSHAVAGNSCPTVVRFSDPVEAFSIVPFGQCDDPQSPHFADQSELFSREEMKPMWFGWDQLKRFLESETHL